VNGRMVGIVGVNVPIVTESRFEACLKRLFQQNLPEADIRQYGGEVY
jgi:hypothetical protein